MIQSGLNAQDIMAQRKKISLPPSADSSAPESPPRRRPPVRGSGTAPRKRPTAAEAEQAREDARLKAQEAAAQQAAEGPAAAGPRRSGGPTGRAAGDRARAAPRRDEPRAARREPDRRADSRPAPDRRDDPRPARSRPPGPSSSSNERIPARQRTADAQPNRRPDDARRGAGPRGDRRDAGPGWHDGPPRQDRSDRTARPDRRPHAGFSDRPDRGERPDPRDRSARARQPARDDRLTPLGRPDRTGRPPHRAEPATGRPARPDRHDERKAAFTPAQRRAAGAPPARPARAPAGAPADTAAPGAEAGIRLSKRMSELGLASRREADEWIVQGWVRVDGQVVAELGSRVQPHQQITVDEAARQQQAQRVTVLLHKPIGYVSGQAEDGYTPAVALVTAENHWAGDRSAIRFSPVQRRYLAPAGRLDIDSTGLLVLTQDGRIAKQLIGEDSPVEKEYLVRVRLAAGQPEGAPTSELLPPEALERLRHGLELDGMALQPAKVSWQNEDQLRFVLREGKKRQIRRMCEAVGLAVVGLKRVRIGRIPLGDLPPGQWRYLRPDERF